MTLVVDQVDQLHQVTHQRDTFCFAFLLTLGLWLAWGKWGGRSRS